MLRQTLDPLAIADLANDLEPLALAGCSLEALAVAALIVTGVWQPGLNVLETTRSFFGVHRVVEVTDGTYRLLYHGTTIHGAMQVRDADGTFTSGRPQPLTYYYFGGPISEAIAAARAAQGGLESVATVGLGAGSLACHRKEGEAWIATSPSAKSANRSSAIARVKPLPISNAPARQPSQPPSRSRRAPARTFQESD